MARFGLILQQDRSQRVWDASSMPPGLQTPHKNQKRVEEIRKIRDFLIFGLIRDFPDNSLLSLCLIHRCQWTLSGAPLQGSWGCGPKARLHQSSLLALPAHSFAYILYSSFSFV